MCGLAGLILKPPCSVDQSWIQALLRSLAHRGPDGCGWLFEHQGEVEIDGDPSLRTKQSAALVHCRLSILDLSDAGRQPMASRDGRYYIVFNGEIYNYLELRSELQALGHEFRTQSDTEVLLAAYAEWGPRALTRLVGMFAFAALDTQARTVFLARDFFGMKPLYYASWDHGLAFASEIKALLELPGVSRSLNPQRLYDYLRFGITDHGEETLLAGIRQLPAAHYLCFSLDDPEFPRPTKYWQIDLNLKVEVSFEGAASRLRDLFLESIQLHMRSDVPVGAALSGGIDSSSVVMAMRRLRPDLEIHAFSYIAANTPVNEEPWIDLIGREGRIQVHKVYANPYGLTQDLDEIIGVQDESFGSTSICAQRWVFRRAQQEGIKVMLDGQGADEILGGYNYSIAARLASLLRQGQWTSAIHFLQRASQLPGLSTVWLALRCADFLVPPRWQRPLRRWVQRDLMPAWMNARWFEERGVEANGPVHRSSPELLKEFLYQELSHNGLPHLLRYEDRNSMAFSIESRLPFLTPALASFLFSLPEEYLIAPDGTSKAVFRRAMKGIVPNPVLNRRDKIGFATPEKDWLLTLRPWVDQVLTSEAARKIPALELNEVQREWKGVQLGLNHFDFRIWRWVNLILWTEKFGVVAP